jgi:hypothetical protein
VNHEIEDYIDIEGAGRKDAEAMRLKEHGVVQQGLDRKHGRVESLQMANLKDAATVACQMDEIVRFCGAGGDGLLNQEVYP